MEAFSQPERQGHGNHQVVMVSFAPGLEGLVGRPGIDVRAEGEELALHNIQERQIAGKAE
jgi:hypothetical protein